PQADEHVHAAVLQVQRMGVALAAEPDDRNGLPLEDLQIGVLIVIDLQHVRVPSFVGARRAVPLPKCTIIFPLSGAAWSARLPGGPVRARSRRDLSGPVP